MEEPGASLTQFLLDLTEDEELSEAFQDDPDAVIESRGLDEYRDLLVSGDVQGLRDAVRAEITGKRQPPEDSDDDDEEPEAIIKGVRVPGVRVPPPPDDPVPGVREPPPPPDPLFDDRESPDSE